MIKYSTGDGESRIMTAVKYSFFIILLFFLSLCLLVGSWTRTPWGRLDMKLAILLKYMSVMKVDLFKENRSIEQIRAFSARGGRILQAAAPGVRQIFDKTIPGPWGPLPLRVYADKTDTGLPIVIYIHGGGWVLGSLDTHDNTCRAIAKKAGVMVLAPDYGLAPEKPYPHGLDEVYATLVWARENAGGMGGDPHRIFLAGDSAGGNLAAATAIRARASNGPAIAGQILIYPALNLHEFNTASYGRFSHGYYLTRRYMEKFRAYYVPGLSDRLSPMVSPLLVQNTALLPPALIVTAQFDILRDEGEIYARRLRNSGVPVRLIRVKGVIHGFLKMDRILSQAEGTLIDIAWFINQAGFNLYGKSM